MPVRTFRGGLYPNSPPDKVDADAYAWVARCESVSPKGYSTGILARA